MCTVLLGVRLPPGSAPSSQLPSQNLGAKPTPPRVREQLKALAGPEAPLGAGTLGFPLRPMAGPQELPSYLRSPEFCVDGGASGLTLPAASLPWASGVGS